LATQTAHDIRLIDAAFGRSLVREACSGLDERYARFVRSVLSRLHERHLGITPKLAVGLTHMIHGSSPTGPWRLVRERLQEVLTEEHDRDAGSRFGIRFDADPAMTVSKLAIPLVARACSRLGVSWLISGEGGVVPCDRGGFEAYERELTNELGTIASDHSNGDLFWKRLAHCFAARAQQRLEEVGGRPVVDQDPLDFAVLWRLGRLCDRHVSKRPPEERRIPIEHLATRRTREGGIDGVHRTRRLEEIRQMLVSEHLNPEPLYLDRLLNSGYMALRRPAKREKKRDLLVMAFFPDCFDRHLSVFLQTCWSEAISELTEFITIRGMLDSEFRLIEGRDHDHCRSFSLFPEDAAATLQLPARADNSRRHNHLISMGWFPVFLETSPLWRTCPSGKDREDPVLAWLGAARQDQKAHRRWLGDDDMDAVLGDDSLDTDLFAHCHVSLMLPWRKGLDDRAMRRDHLLATRLLTQHARREPSLDITYVPDRLKLDRPWLRTTGSVRHRFLRDREKPAVNDLAGELIDHWTFLWKGELHAR